MTYYSAPGIVRQKERAYRFEDVEGAVCKYYGFTPDQVYRRDRREEVVICRHVIAFLAVEFLSMGTKGIGERMGKRDHTTVVNSRKAVAGMLATREEMREDIAALRERIKMAPYE